MTFFIYFLFIIRQWEEEKFESQMFDREQRIENREQKEDPRMRERMRERQGLMHFLISDIPHYNQLNLLIVQFCYTSNYQEWQRIGFGLGFSIPRPNPWVLARGPNPARLLTGFFSQGPNPPPQALPDLGQIRSPTKKKKRIEWPLPISLCLFFFLVYKI